jgi:hypothetical protein
MTCFKKIAKRILKFIDAGRILRRYDWKDKNFGGQIQVKSLDA